MIVVETREHVGRWNRRRARRWGRRHGYAACWHPVALEDSHPIDLGARKVRQCLLCGAVTLI